MSKIPPQNVSMVAKKRKVMPRKLKKSKKEEKEAKKKEKKKSKSQPKGSIRSVSVGSASGTSNTSLEDSAAELTDEPLEQDGTKMKEVLVPVEILED